MALIRFIDSLGWNVKHDLKKKEKKDLHLLKVEKQVETLIRVFDE